MSTGFCQQVLFPNRQASMGAQTEEAEENNSEDRKRKSRGGRPVRCDQFPVASAMINRLMPGLMEHVKQEPALQRKLFQVQYVTTHSRHHPE